MRSMRLTPGVMLLAALAPASFGASTYSFTGVSATNVNNTAAGVAQLSVLVDSAGSGFASFLFSNTGPAACSIANIYFDDNSHSLAGISSIVNGAGVRFGTGGTPNNLPAGANIGFAADFRAKANNPAPSNGVNPGEHVTLVMALRSNITLNSVVSAMNAGDLRVGMHVISFANGGSESFVNGMPPLPPPPVTGVPLPSAAGLGLIGLGTVAGRRRRR